MSRTAHKLMASSGGKAYEIEQSLMFNAADTAYLKRTPSSAGNRRTFTLSTWIKLTSSSFANGAIFGCGISTTDAEVIYLSIYQGRLSFQTYNTTWRRTTSLLRDVGAWYHIVFAIDTTQSTAQNRIRIYINGEEETSFSTNSNPSQNYDFIMNTTNEHQLGDEGGQTGGINPWDGYMSEFHFIDGTQLTPSSFGETDSDTGQWVPKKVSGLTYGTNGFYLDFVNNTENGITAAASTFTAPFGGTASNATADDGNYIISNTTTGAAFDLWHVDLGSAKYVLSILQHNMKFTGGTSTFKVYYSNDNSNWTETASFSVSASYQDLNTSQGIAARYWKMKATAFGVNGEGHVDFVNLTIGGIGADVSGQGNDYTPTNLANADIYLDSPTNNFAVHNSEGSSSATSFTVGNLWGKATSNSFSKIISTLAPSSGKWYCEYYVKGTQHNGSVIGTSTRAEGAVRDSSNQSGTALNDETTWLLQHNTSSYQRIYRSSNVEQENLGNVSVGDVLSIAMDVDNSKAYFRKNNTIVGSSSGHTINTVEGGDRYFFAFHPRAQSGYTGHGIVNYGQNSSFNGLKTAQGNTDGNGIGDFYYAPPSGFLALCSKNLATPAIKNGTEHFNTVTYTGSDDGAVSQSVTGVGFEPDLVIIKRRDAAASPAWWDQVRGEHKGLNSDGTDEEKTDTYGLETFNSDGFTVRESDTAQGKTNTGTLVAWNWKAGGSGSSNSDGAQTTTVSANTTAGFSIVTLTGIGSSTTYGHGLGTTPKLVILKSRSVADNWYVFSTAADGTTDYYFLNTTAAKTDSSGIFPSSSTFSTSYTNGVTIVAYCFVEIEGYSKISTYLGNGGADGPFINTGFKPGYILIKSHTDADNWHICDVVRSPGNPHNDVLRANLSNAESADHAGFDVDSYSNGFKIRSTNSELNTSAKRYIYMAFAESPVKYANAR